MKRIVILIAVAIAASTSVIARVDTEKPRHEGAFIGFALGVSGGYDGYNIPSECTRPDRILPFPALMLKFGASLTPNLLITWENNVSTVLISTYFHTNLVVSVYPFREWGLYFKSGIGYGGTSFYCGGPSGSASGFDIRTGVGYEFLLGESFNLGIEVANSIILTGDGYLTNTVGLLTFSWY